MENCGVYSRDSKGSFRERDAVGRARRIFGGDVVFYLDHEQEVEAIVGFVSFAYTKRLPPAYTVLILLA